MYDFILNMWVMRRIDKSKMQLYVTKRYIDQDQADMILVTPQIQGGI